MFKPAVELKTPPLEPGAKVGKGSGLPDWQYVPPAKLNAAEGASVTVKLKVAVLTQGPGVV
jgi:hypothetical protein